MEELPEECLHLIYKFCFDDVLNNIPKPKNSYAINFNLIDPLPTFTIHELLSSFTSNISLYYIEAKYKPKEILENTENKRENLFIKCIELKPNFDLTHILQQIIYCEKSSNICFRNEKNPIIENDRNIFIEVCNEFQKNIVLGLLIDWKQYI